MPSPCLPSRLKLKEIPSKEQSERFALEEPDSQPVCYSIISADDSKPLGFIVVDNTKRGPGLGGIRIAKDVQLNEVKRLARAMTLKNSAACLPYGGGKAGVQFDPDLLNQEPGLKRDLIGMLAEVLFAIPEYICAPDMGTNETDMQQIYDRFASIIRTPKHSCGGAGRPPSKGGIPIDDWGLTAHSLYASIKTYEQLENGFSLPNSTAVIQGYGNVGSMIAEKLITEGVCIVGASDINVGLYNPQGLNVEELSTVRKQPGGLLNYQSPVEKQLTGNQLDWLMEAPCDILIPAARPDALTAKNTDRIQCRYVFQGANAPCNKMTEYYLWNRRKILNFSDFIVNVGGVMGCAVELKMGQEDEYRKKVLSDGQEGRTYLEKLIYNTVAENIRELHSVMQAGKDSDKLFREYAEEMALRRLECPDMIWL